MKRLIYLPLEKYSERYTEWLSSAGGAIESELKRLGIPFIALRPHTQLGKINTGYVLDVDARLDWASWQTRKLNSMIVNKEITSEDVIFIDDFWHPGMEMIPYAMSLVFGPLAKWPAIYSYNYAQSADPNDFTYKWKWWIKPFEMSWANCHAGIFLSCKEHKELTVKNWENEYGNKIYPVGLLFNSKAVKKLGGSDVYVNGRDKIVVWSSRWDKEKNPAFFMHLAQAVIEERDDISFIVCTGFKTLRSNEPRLVVRAKVLQESFPGRFRIFENIPKSIYYRILSTSKVQFNSADQDWVSFTLLEATTFGCAPLYPNYLSFPAALENKEKHLYEKGNLWDAKTKLYNLIDSPSEDYSWVYKKYEDTLKRMLVIMGFSIKEEIIAL